MIGSWPCSTRDTGVHLRSGPVSQVWSGLGLGLQVGVEASDQGERIWLTLVHLQLLESRVAAAGWDAGLLQVLKWAGGALVSSSCDLQGGQA